MARSVADAAAVLAGISGEDANDVATQASAGHVVGDYAPHLKADGLTGARIGVVRDLMGYQPDVDAAMEKAIAAMQAEGATVVDADIATLNDWNGAEFMVLKYELKAGLARYLTESGAPVTSPAEIGRASGRGRVCQYV